MFLFWIILAIISIILIFIISYISIEELYKIILYSIVLGFVKIYNRTRKYFNDRKEYTVEEMNKIFQHITENDKQL